VSDSTKVQLVRDFIEAVRESKRTGDRSRVWPFLHEDVEVIEPASVPFGGVHSGHDGYLRLQQEILATWRPIPVPTAYFDMGDAVIKRSDFRAALPDDAGTEVEVPLLELFELEDGRIRRIIPFYFDTKAICDAVEAVR
jgi:ketosteroid isomerase-like protein